MSVSSGESTRRRGLLTAIAVGLALSLTLPALAQVNTGVVEVVLVDTDGAPLPGASIEVVNNDTGLRRALAADARGMAVVPALPPGTYKVTADLPGFAQVLEDNLELLVGQTARLRMVMRPKVSETIEVTAEAPIVDVYKSDTSTNIVPEQIQQLPTPNRDFQKLAFIAPGVQRERGGYRFISGAPLVGSSGNASETTILVDGVDFTDEALGLARTRFSQDAIREFRVITNRFDAEIGHSAGGALSIVTRSGSNEVHGSAFGFYRADSLRSQGKLETGDQNFSRYQVGATIGGPIVKDRTHYFLSIEYVDESNIAAFRPLGAFADRTKDLDHPFTQFLGLASIDHQINPSQTLQAKVVGETYREQNFRVGGVADESSGMDLNRDNYNLTLGHTWVIGGDSLNELRGQMGRKKFAEPNNSDQLSEYFSFGTTLITGANIVGDQDMKGDYFELRDTYHMHLAGATSTHDLKLGGSAQWVSEDWYFPVFPQGLMFWLDDTRTMPYRYDYGVGPSDTKVDTTLYGIFAQDEWRPNPNTSVTLGVRYDYDTDGNNPDFTHPLEPEKRHVDDNNIQPRVGFTYDLTGKGETVLRGGVGQFTGRYLLVPAFTELQQNGITGRTLYTRLNGLFFGLPPAFWMDPNDPENTGLLLAPNIALLEPSLQAPEAVQASLGFSQKLMDSGLYLDVEALYAKGKNEIVIRDTNFGGNANPVFVNPAYTQINKYTNDGHSKYKALIVSLKGNIPGGHLLACNVTVSSKKNISDDFSPALTAYPSDPANIEAEYGRSRSDERYRVVLSGIFHLPWDLTLAPIYEYGSGQPWTRRLGYDYNGDLRLSDRAAGVSRNGEDGPDFKSLSLRLTKTIAFNGGDLDLIIEGFNLLNNTNYDVNSIDNAEYLSGPTIANPAASYVPNPNFGNYSATLDPREIQLGVRYRF